MTFVPLASPDAATVVLAFDYQLLLAEGRGYLPLGRLTAAARVQFGHIFTQGESSPITRRFYAGGANSHRGFNYNRLSQQVPACAPPCSDPPSVRSSCDRARSPALATRSCCGCAPNGVNHAS